MSTTARVLIRCWGLDRALLCLGAIAIIAAAAPRVLGLPQVGAIGPIVSPTGSIAGWAVASTALIVAREPSWVLVRSAPLGRRLDNPLRVALVAALGVVLLVMIAQAPAVATMSSTACLLGEGLVLAAVAGLELAWLLPTAHVMAAMTLGAVGRTDLAAWAWILRSPGSTAGLGVACVVLVAGLTIWAVALGPIPVLVRVRH